MGEMDYLERLEESHRELVYYANILKTPGSVYHEYNLDECIRKAYQLIKEQEFASQNTKPVKGKKIKGS